MVILALCGSFFYCLHLENKVNKHTVRSAISEWEAVFAEYVYTYQEFNPGFKLLSMYSSTEQEEDKKIDMEQGLRDKQKITYAHTSWLKTNKQKKTPYLHDY